MTVNKHLLKPVSLVLVLAFTLSCSDSSDSESGGGDPISGNLCNGKSYDSEIYRCERGELIGSCKGKDYYIAYEQCDGGVVVDKGSSSSSSGGGNSSSSKGSLPSSNSMLISSSSSNNNSSSSNAEAGNSSVALSSSSIPPSSSSIDSSSSVENSGTFTDNRDGKTYKWVRIGEQVWMDENLRYFNVLDVKFDYSGNYLYDWATAMGLSSNCNSTICSASMPLTNRGICPIDWHIPNMGEWQKISALLGNEWWSDTETDKNTAFCYFMKDGVIKRSSSVKSNQYSVRCIKD